MQKMTSLSECQRRKLSDSNVAMQLSGKVGSSRVGKFGQWTHSPASNGSLSYEGQECFSSAPAVHDKRVQLPLKEHVDCHEEYDHNRFLVSNVTREVSKEDLVFHIKGTRLIENGVLSDVIFSSKDETKAVVFSSEDLVGSFNFKSLLASYNRALL